MAHRSYVNASRDITWGDDDSRSLTLEQITLGAVLRIAMAVEKMADPYVRLVQRVAYLEKRLDEELTSGKRLRRRIIALRGVVTRTKKRPENKE